MLRSIVSSVILIGLLFTAVPSFAADTEPISVGAREQAERTYQRMTLVGMIGVVVKVTTVDGSVPDPLQAYLDGTAEKLDDVKELSAPDVGDDAVMLSATITEGEVTANTVILLALEDDRLAMIAGIGLTPFVDEFVPLAESLVPMMLADGTLIERLPTLDDLPAGFALDSEAYYDADGNEVDHL